MRPFTIATPTTVEEAIAAALSGGRFIAGGTTLVDLMREGVETPDRLVDISHLPLNEIRLREGDLWLGALTPMSDVAADPLAQARQPLVVEALLAGASPQLRNMATIGGNLLQRVRCPYFRTLDADCNKRSPGSGCAALEGLNRNHAILGVSDHCIATHPSDLAVALVALDAELHVHGRSGARRLPVQELYRLPKDTPHLEHVLEPGDLIVAVSVPENAFGRHVAYVKVRDRASYEFAVVSVAAALEIDRATGSVRQARIAAGGVGAVPWRLAVVEDALRDRPLGADAYQRAAALATTNARPVPQNRFKLDLLPRTIVRALEIAGGAA